MSNANRYRGAIHALDAEGCYTLCGVDANALVLSSELTADCTCRRCLASLAKRDREFRAKARLGLRLAWSAASTDLGRWRAFLSGMNIGGADAAHAIAREEGRAL